MSEQTGNILRSIRPNKILYPILIGLGVVVFMMYRDLNISKLKVNLVGITATEKKWISLEENDTQDTLVATLLDSTVIAQDKLLLHLEYFIQEGSSISETISDTVELDNRMVATYSHVKAWRSGADSIVFVFSSPLESPFSVIRFTWKSLFWFLLACSMMLVRDFGYMLRIRILSDNDLSWTQSFNLIMLWEFTSALTPSVVGGTGVAIFLINKEGIRLGRSSAIVAATSFLDELYFVVMVPFVFLFVSATELFTVAGSTASPYDNEFFYFALVGYSLIFVYTAAIGYALLINPKGFKWLLVKVFSLPLLKKWKEAAARTGDEIIQNSKELRVKSAWFWAKAFGATVFSWTGRYWIVNLLLVTFFVVNDHFLIFARQLIMWIMMLVSPTPGGSGFSEYVFKAYLGEFIHPIGLSIALALLWRFITYYPYLFIGAIILPRWIKRKFGKKSTEIFDAADEELDELK